MIIGEMEEIMLKQNIEELEQRKVELFRLKDMLTIRKRELSKEIKDAKEKLKYELELEKEFGVIKRRPLPS